MRLYRTKREWIKPYIEDRDVLDLGCVNHDMARASRKDWLHGYMVQHARTVTGVDYLRSEVAALNDQGYHIVCANVETMDLGRTFDVIVAGDLIEHLDNPGLFLERVKAHLAEDGRFLVTTPNPTHALRFVAHFIRGEINANSEHTCWFSSKVMRQLVARHGLAVEHTYFIDDAYQYYLRSKKWWPLLPFNYVLAQLRPQFSETFAFVIKRARRDH